MTRKIGNFGNKDNSAASGTDAHGPMTGITCHNFTDLGVAFMRANGSTGFIIVRDRESQPPSQPGVDPYPVTPREWAAWVAWRKSKGIGNAYWQRTGWATVPSRWPEGFDADWTPNRSVDAANRFQDLLDRQRPMKDQPDPTPEDRKAMVEKLMRHFRAV